MSIDGLRADGSESYVNILETLFAVVTSEAIPDSQFHETQ